MRLLRLVGVDDAGAHLVLQGDDGQQYTVPFDEPLLAVTRRIIEQRAANPSGSADTSSNPNSSKPDAPSTEGQVHSPVTTQADELRPRDIQARVRAGESPEDLSAATGVELDRVQRYARPVMQEREHVAETARRVLVRTEAHEGPLGEVVGVRLALVTSPDLAAWDAWRRDDGRWTVQLAFRDAIAARLAHWSFDPTTNSVTIDDEMARWLTDGTGPAPSAPPIEAELADGAAATAPRTGRRLLSVPDLAPEPANSTYDEDEIADELAALGLQPVPHEEQVAQQEEAAAADEIVVPEPEPAAAEPTVAEPTVAEPTEPGSNESAADEANEASESGEQQVAFDIPAERPEKPAKRTAKKSAKRASVPSWDDIVFGASRPTD